MLNLSSDWFNLGKSSFHYSNSANEMVLLSAVYFSQCVFDKWKISPPLTTIICYSSFGIEISNGLLDESCSGDTNHSQNVHTLLLKDLFSNLLSSTPLITCDR